MSNCISLSNESVFFKKDEIDLLKLKEVLDATPHTLAECEVLDKTDKGWRAFCWWFLKDNTHIALGDTGAVIKFGEGRSSHTWRDFRGIVNHVIKPLMLKNKVHVFQVEDEGFPGWGDLPIIFGQDNLL